MFFNVLAAAAAKDNNRDQNDDPAIIVAEERIETTHLNAPPSLLKDYVMRGRCVKAVFDYRLKNYSSIVNVPKNSGRWKSGLSKSMGAHIPK